ncbi:MAG: hypothetical protein Q9160_004983 [Pyrenula sp. 1 TL-2023]
MSFSETAEPSAQFPVIKREQCAPDPFQIPSEAENLCFNPVEHLGADSRGKTSTTIQDLSPELLTSILKDLPETSIDSVAHSTRTLSTHMFDTAVLRHQYLRLLPRRLDQPPFFDPPCLWDSSAVPTHRVCDACDTLKPLDLYVDPFKHHYEVSSSCLPCLAKRRWAQGSPSDDKGEEEGEIAAGVVLVATAEEEACVVEGFCREATEIDQHALIVISSTTLIFTVCGLAFAFGVYQDLYTSLSHDPSSPFSGSSPAEIDLIGTLAISFMTIGAPFATAWTKRYPPYMVVWSGGVVFFAALLLASFSQRLWQFELTQGFLGGVGTCLTYMPAVTVAPTWFTARRGLAMGIVLSGTGVGGVVWAPILHAMIARIGFRNTLRVSGAIAFVLITAAGYVMHWEPATLRRLRVEATTPPSPGITGLFKIPLVDYRIVRTRKSLAQALSGIFQAAAYYTPVFFFASYARTLGYSSSTASNFIALSNAANAIGKIVIGHTADRVIGRINTLFLTTAISALTALSLWLPSSLLSSSHPPKTPFPPNDDAAASRNLFIAFAILYGIFASAYVSLFPASLVELFEVQHFASVNGALYMMRGLATLARKLQGYEYYGRGAADDCDGGCAVGEAGGGGWAGGGWTA